MPAPGSFAVHPDLDRLVDRVTLSPETAAGSHLVLPGPFPTLGFQLRGRLQVSLDGSWQPLHEAGVTGLCGSHRVFAQEEPTRTVLIRLMPWAVPALFRESARALVDGHVSLVDLLPRGQSAGWLGREPDDAVGEAQALLARLARSARPASPIAVEGARLILRRGGMITVGELETALGWSRRHIERVFIDSIGVPPKRFAALVRFHRAAQALRAGRTPADVALQYGYFDQSHFANEFRRFAGRPPSAVR
jgi:AraC-like DNA-binding protein